MRVTRWAIGLLLGASACVHRLSTDMNVWVGKDESALVSALGAPNRTADLPNGQKVYTWVTSWNTSGQGERPVMADCNRSFTLGGGHVLSWSAHGCPGVYTR